MKRRMSGKWGLVAAALIAGLMVGCKSKPEPKFATLDKGAEIDLILVMELQAGADAVGTVVPYMATHDVVDAAGNVIVKQGAIAYGKIVRSRSEGTLSALVNKPARLDVTINEIDGADGTKIKLSAVQDGPQTAPLELNRANTGVPQGSEYLDRAWGDESRRADLVKLAQLIEASKNSDLSANPATADLLQKLSSELDLQAASKLKDRKDVDKVAALLGQIATGQTDLGAFGEASLGQLGAVIEFTKVVGYVGDRLGDALKGRTIHAYVGTPVKAYVIEPAKIKLPEPE